MKCATENKVSTRLQRMCEFQSWHRLETSGRCSEVNWKMLFPTLYCQIEKNTVQGTFLLTSLQQCITVHWSLQIFAVQCNIQCSALHTVQCNAHCGAKCKMQCSVISKAVQCKKQNVKCSPVCTAGTSTESALQTGMQFWRHIYVPLSAKLSVQ